MVIANRGMQGWIIQVAARWYPAHPLRTPTDEPLRDLNWMAVSKKRDILAIPEHDSYGCEVMNVPGARLVGDCSI